MAESSGWDVVNMILNRPKRFERLNEAEKRQAEEELARYLEESDDEPDPFVNSEDEDESYVPPPSPKKRLLASANVASPAASTSASMFTDVDLVLPDDNDDASDVESSLDVELGVELDDDDDETQNDIVRSEAEAAIATFEHTGDDERPHYISKNGTKWFKDIPVLGRIRAHNCVNFTRNRPGPSPCLIADPLAIFKSFIDENMVHIIIRETNRKGAEITNKWNKSHLLQQKKWTPVTLKEFYAYLGVLLYSGCYQSNTEPTKELWSSTHNPLYKATMSHNRFITITKFLRFDNGLTREQRLTQSKSAAIDDIWLLLNANLEKNYIPHESITVDEQLFPFRGRTRFTQYIPSKPAKYGIKVWWACDSKSFYPLKGMIYTGKLPNAPRDVNQGERVVLELVKKYFHSGRTIYADNFFSSLNLATVLMSKRLAYVGTIRKNKPYIPPTFLANKSRPEFSTLFGYHNGDVSLCSFVPKLNRAVLLISTMHYTNAVDESSIKRKPLAILDYNSHKSGVDTMDQMLGKYTCKRSTKRWPLAYFFNLLDVAALAAYIIHDELVPQKKTDRRRGFLKELATQLVIPHMEERAHQPRVITHTSVRFAMGQFNVHVSKKL